MNTKTKLLRAAVALSFVMAIASNANAQIVLFSTDFSAPTYSDGVLNSGADTSTPGQDGWITTSGGGTNAIAVSNSAVDGFVSLTTSGQDVRRLFDGAATVTSGSVFFRADVTVTAAQAAGDYAMHFSDGGVSNFYARTYFRSSGGGFQMALGTGAGAVTYGTTVLSFSTPIQLLVRFDMVPGAGNDTGALYINPTTPDGSGDTPYVNATTIGTDPTTIAAMALRQGTAGSAATLTIDNIEVFTPIPEPTSMALVGVGLAGFVGNRLRRRKAAK